MLGFSSFASAPFASTGSGVVVRMEASFVGEAILQANANADFILEASILGEAIVNTDGTIVGSGWTRINPDTPEWDITQSKDWNAIK